MSFTVAPALVHFGDEGLQNEPCGVVVMTGTPTRAWSEKGGRFYGISLAPTRKKSPQHIAVAVGGVCTARIEESNIRGGLHLGKLLYVKRDAGVLTSVDPGGGAESVAVFLQKIDTKTARVWLTSHYTPAQPGNLPTFGLGGASTTGGVHEAKRLRTSLGADDGIDDIYRRIDAARN